MRVRSSTGHVSVNLLIAKSKVAPLKSVTLPRLELCAAYLLAQLIDYVQQSLNLRHVPCVCWSDSTITLGWIRESPARWKTFVANRVARIQELVALASWRHVPTQDNPADCASRGMFPSELPNFGLWWSGPPWLEHDEAHWPALKPPPDSTSCPELRAGTAVHTASPAVSWDLQSKFSSWNKLIRVTAWLLRFVDRVRHKPPPPNATAWCLHPDELHQARVYWIKQAQRDLFPAELAALQCSRLLPKSSALRSLTPFLDPHGVLRVQGRLQKSSLPPYSKHPIILRSHPIVHLIVRDAHLRHLHAGPQLLISILRQTYWILRARQCIRAIIYQCVPCTRSKAGSSEELMGNLPQFRVTPSSRAFVHTGTDYAGPISLRLARGRGHRSYKGYIAVFICMVTKAIHLEVVSSYSTAEFIAAYQRFVARRGLPSHIYSDNGTNFQGAERELTTAYHAALRDSDLSDTAANQGVAWHFLPPSAPHFGGLWEAAVRSMKSHLRRCVGTNMLTFEEMTTLLCRIEACLNSRPLVQQSDNLDDWSVLTPGHFLIGSSLVAPPEPSVLHIAEARLSRWQLVQQIHERFWKLWSSDYLQTLQQRVKWRSRGALITPGQLVLLKDSGLPPSRWALGRIITCHPGEDGLVRVVTIKTATSEYKRPIVKLCFLPVNINETEQPNSVTAGGAPVPDSEQ